MQFLGRNRARALEGLKVVTLGTLLCIAGFYIAGIELSWVLVLVMFGALAVTYLTTALLYSVLLRLL